MNTIIVITDFSPTSANALDYACAFAAAYRFKINLTHIYTIPATYSGEGLSIVTINDELDVSRRNLKNELDRVNTAFPGVKIAANMLVGGFLDTLRALKKELNPEMMVLGAEYTELPLWDENWLDALVTLSCPVLVIPQNVRFEKIRNIGFACDYKKPCLPYQVGVIKKLVMAAGAKLHVIHVSPQAATIEDHENVTALKKAFTELAPEYYFIADKQVIKSISAFTEQNHIDLLLVMPHKHGLWHRLFSKSYTRQLARFNHLPVMAIHE